MSSRKPANFKGPETSEPSTSGSFHSNIQLPPITMPGPSGPSSAMQPIYSMHGQYQHEISSLDPSIPRHVPSISTTSTRRPGIAVADIINPNSPNSPTGNASTTTSSSVLASPVPEPMIISSSASNMVMGSPARPRPEFVGITRTTIRQQDPLTSDESPRNPFSGQTTLAHGSSFGSAGLAEGNLSQRDRDRMKLKIRQQPRAARACGLGERDRRVIDPPPILQLYLEDYNPHSTSDKSILKSPFNMVSCSLISVGDNSSHQPGQDVSMVNDPSDPSKDMRRLMGQLTISPFITEDLHASHGTPEDARIGSYYIFSDLSCRQNGRYKLRFTLLPFDATAIPIGGWTATAAVVESDDFTVYSAKDFPGMQQSSELTKKLKNLGASVPIKKGNEGRLKKGAKKRASDSDGSGNET